MYEIYNYYPCFRFLYKSVVKMQTHMSLLTPPFQNGPGAHPAPSLLYNGYLVFPGGKERPGRDAEPSPLLVQWSWKGRAIPLLPLWAVLPVQSLSACTRVHFTKHSIILRSSDRASWQILTIKPTICTNFSNLFWNETQHVLDSSFVHHQEFFTVHTAMVYVILKFQNDIHHCCVNSENLLMMDKGIVQNT